ncbi:MAG: hypothetical protein ACE5GW_13855, partial [Planctomycetota bacterium]
VQLEVDGISVVGVTTPDRWLSSFLATIDGVVVVSNSIPQLQRIAETAAGGHASLRDLPEYTFFRDRYRRGDPDESALLILSDATIRRWCGPRWRIGASRRTRAAATLSELQARWMEDLAARGIERAGGALSGELLQVDFPHPELEKLTVTPEGVMSSSYGTLEFLTPILELSIEKVTPSEAAAYRQYRDRYQRRWPRFFDPIAVRVSLTAERVAVDTTVMPLIDRSEYREYIDLASGARIGLRDGDPHPGTILHVVTSLNPEGRMVRMLEGFLHSPASPFNPHPLAWMGNYCALYLDADPEWERVVRAAETRDERVAALRTEPLGVSIAVRDPLRLAGFLTLLRGLSAVAAPEMLVWESREHNGQSYVKVQLSAPMAGDPQEEELALYYAPTKRILHLSLREDVLHRALDRTREGLEGEAKADPSAGNGDAWLGENLALKVNRRVLDVARTLFRDTYQQRMQHRSFGNLAILNEWKRLYPHENPIALHERIWKTRLRCPGGGNYAWNERFQTMESTIYGHPADPRAGAKFPLPLREIHSLNLGVTFENDGLRAHAQIVREQ